MLPPPSPAHSAAPADWMRERYRWDRSWTDDGVGRGFASYVRVFHPFGEGDEAQTWAQVAAEHGKTMHPTAWWDEITTDGPWSPGAGPRDTDGIAMEGNLPRSALSTVCTVLRRHTATPEHCYFGVWDGWGWSSTVSVSFTATSGGVHDEPPSPLPVQLDPNAPAFEVPHRRFLLYRGVVEQALEIGGGDYYADVGFFWEQSPTLMWPADHAWCLATEIDLPYTMVGGSQALATDLLAASGIECLAVDPDAPLFSSVNQA